MFCLFNSLSPSTQPANESKLIEQLESPTNFPANSFIDDSKDSRKWSCKCCTYLNWPKAQYCLKCNTKRENTLSASVEHLSEDMKKFNLRGTPDPDPDPSILSSNYSKTNSPLASSSNLAASLATDCSKKSEIKWHCNVSIFCVVLFVGKNLEHYYYIFSSFIHSFEIKIDGMSVSIVI